MKEYKVPNELLDEGVYESCEEGAFAQKSRAIIADVCKACELDAEVNLVAVGPSVTTFRLASAKAVPAKRVRTLENECSLRLTSAVRCYPDSKETGLYIEVPNEKRGLVWLSETLRGLDTQAKKPRELNIVLGKDTKNEDVIADITKLSHILVAGCSGSGKSIFLNAVITSLIVGYAPNELQLVLIDPKRVEFALYNGLPHLLTGEIVTDLRTAISALQWVVSEMERRYALMEQASRKNNYIVNINEYNELDGAEYEKLPKLVIVIDEFADLILAGGREVENQVQKIVQKARAAGIYLILATQRPSADVLTGAVKANFGTRVCFKVATETDSRVVLDKAGAQSLLGWGDYFFVTPYQGEARRLQAPYVSGTCIKSIVEYLKTAYPAKPNEDAVLAIAKGVIDRQNSEVDSTYINALRYVVESGTVSMSMIQRKCSVGYNKAGKIVEWMEEKGYISGFDGSARKVFLDKANFQELYGE